MLPRMIPIKRWFALGVIFLSVVPCLAARVTRVEITSRADVLEGKPFGESGAYERITGRVYFAVAVANIHNQPIVDLGNAECIRMLGEFTQAHPELWAEDIGEA